MQHTIEAYDNELRRLSSIVTQMGGLAEEELVQAVKSLMDRDPDRARQVIEMDKKLDRLEVEADDLVIQMIALRSPMADDLRDIISALKITSMLERIGDFAKNIAKRVTVISQAEPVAAASSIPRMAQEAQKMIKDVLDAFVEKDADKAVAVWQSDDKVDALYNSLFRELLTYMMESPDTITAGTHFLFIAKNIERIGDQATNIAEVVYYAAKGEPLDDNRPKADTTAFATIDSPSNK